MDGDLHVDVLDPNNPQGAKVTACFPSWLLNKWLLENRTMYWNVIPAKEVLDNTTSIFSGVRKAGEDRYCYVGKPKIWHTHWEPGYERADFKPFHASKVLLVFLDSEFKVYGFRPEEMHVIRVDCPVYYDERFESELWSNSSFEII